MQRIEMSLGNTDARLTALERTVTSQGTTIASQATSITEVSRQTNTVRSQLETLLRQACPGSNAFVRGFGTDGSILCGAPDSSASAEATRTAVAPPPVCQGPGKTLQWDGSQWSCRTAFCTLPWGGLIADGQSVEAWNQSTYTVSSSRCFAETRVCSNGVLSGSLQHAGCSFRGRDSGNGR